jgi:hypothetical protein
MFATDYVVSGLNLVLNQLQVIIRIRAKLESNVMKTCFVAIIRVGVLNDLE